LAVPVQLSCMQRRQSDVEIGVPSITAHLPDLSGVQKVASTSLTALTAVSPSTMIAPMVSNATAVHSSLEAVKKPLEAAAGGTRMSGLQRAVSVLGKSLAGVVVVTSALQGARIVSGGGPAALLETKQGRAAVLGATGGALALTPVPPLQLAGAVVLAGAAANEFGAFDRFDTARSVRSVQAASHRT
jgi:hypothetical protein